ncbi:MAG TPA: hypothetical protein VEF89_13040 [Solirubrobacteraceae bacterium]|nr:hypothetical protein [Solirubrobacteraceae bacterium]
MRDPAARNGRELDALRAEAEGEAAESLARLSAAKRLGELEALMVEADSRARPSRSSSCTAKG